MSVAHAVVVRLMPRSGSERGISPPRSQVYVFSSLTHADINFIEKGPVRASKKKKKTLERRCQRLWSSIQELEKPSCQWID